jgi:peptidoglycan glycosyltransferase
MQDLKHLNSKKRFYSAVSSRNGQINRRLADSRGNVSWKSGRFSGKQRQQLSYLLLFLAIVLVVTPVCLFTIHKALQAAKVVMAWFPKSPTPGVAEAARQPAVSPFEIASSLLESANSTGEQLIARTNTSETLHYTIQSALQKQVHDFMAVNKVPYGVFVAIEPATGRILAMTSHSTINPGWEKNAFFDLYPSSLLLKPWSSLAADPARKIPGTGPPNPTAEAIAWTSPMPWLNR